MNNLIPLSLRTTNGKKYAVYKAILARLKDAVENLENQPKIKFLQDLSLSYLLDDNFLERYVYNFRKNPSTNLPILERSLVIFLLAKCKNKPQKFSFEEMHSWQKLCLPTTTQLRTNIILWWIKNHKKKVII